jgi:hypothetical protein
LERRESLSGAIHGIAQSFSDRLCVTVGNSISFEVFAAASLAG